MRLLRLQCECPCLPLATRRKKPQLVNGRTHSVAKAHSRASVEGYRRSLYKMAHGRRCDVTTQTMLNAYRDGRSRISLRERTALMESALRSRSWHSRD